ncbi:MAG: MFS transporter [Clostridiales bacterium]|nr:MFS transporter [Clostridiales bacterium]
MKNSRTYKIAYTGFLWHAFFLALTMSMLDLNTVFPALVSELTGSKTLFGLLYSIMLGVPVLFNLLFSHFLKVKRKKKKYLLLGIYLRSIAFLGMAVFTYFFALSKPMLVFGSFFLWISIFSLSGGLAGISYVDIMAKSIPSSKRTNLYAVKQFFSSVAAFLGGIAISKIFTVGSLNYPNNYSLSLLIGFIGLLIAAIGFQVINEPPSDKVPESREPLREYLKKVPKYLKSDFNFRRFIIVENMASFSVMIMPFYMIFAKEMFGIDNSYIGRYLLFQITGTILSTFLWGLLAKKFNSKTIVRTCNVLGGLIPLVAIGLSYLGPDYFAIVFLFIGVVISGRRIGFEPYFLEIAPSEHRTEYLGIRGTLNIFIVILPIMGGIFIENLGYYFTFVLVSVIMIASSFLLKKETIPLSRE